MKYRYSLHKINNEDQISFSEQEYSQFKFGDTRMAKKFADELFAGFIKEYKHILLEQEEIILFPSPYDSIPTASNFLCFYLKQKLNNFLYEHDKKACVQAKIYRNQTYTEDYGQMDFQQRIDLISNDTYYIDRHFIEGKFCLFLDDIKITGSHELTVERILEQYQVQGTFLFLYYAELMNKNIHPSIENRFNYAYVKSIQDLLKIVDRPTFRYNTRVIKYILSSSEVLFTYFLDSVSEELRRELFENAISNNYHQIEEYQKNIKHLKKQLLWQSTYKKDKEKI